MNDAPKILDLNKIKPPERKVLLKNKEIILSKIPSRVTLEIAEKYEELNDPNNSKAFDDLMSLTMKIINSQNDDSEITKDWLIDNTDFEQLYALMEFLLEPVKERAEEEAKNRTAPVRAKK